MPFDAFQSSLKHCSLIIIPFLFKHVPLPKLFVPVHLHDKDVSLLHHTREFYNMKNSPFFRRIKLLLQFWLIFNIFRITKLFGFFYFPFESLIHIWMIYYLKNWSIFMTEIRHTFSQRLSSSDNWFWNSLAVVLSSANKSR